MMMMLVVVLVLPSSGREELGWRGHLLASLVVLHVHDSIDGRRADRRFSDVIETDLVWDSGNTREWGENGRMRAISLRCLL